MAPLDDSLGGILERREKSSRLRRLTTRPPSAVDFSSNDYLSLASDITLQKEILSRLEARIHAVERGEIGRGILGSGGSRLLDGNSNFAEDLERKIAAFHGAPAALLFNSAYDANVGLLSCVPLPGDIILFDEAIHASVHDGMRMSRAARRIPFAHSSITDGRNESARIPSLEEVLMQITEGDQGRDVREGRKNVFICVEGMYSMDGAIADLHEVVAPTEKCLPLKNGHIIVDEAHSIGVLGNQGRGLVSEHGLEQKIWARVHGFGKAMGCAGGVILCSEIARAYLINYARNFIYTTSMTYSSLVNLDTIYDFLRDGRGQPHHEQLHSLTTYTARLLQEMCLRLGPEPGGVSVGSMQSRSPIIPVYTAAPRSLAASCQAKGFMVRPIVAPTVPAGTERIRVCLHANNTFKQVEALIKTIEDWAKTQAPAAGQSVERDLQALDLDLRLKARL